MSLLLLFKARVSMKKNRNNWIFVRIWIFIHINRLCKSIFIALTCGSWRIPNLGSDCGSAKYWHTLYRSVSVTDNAFFAWPSAFSIFRCFCCFYFFCCFCCFCCCWCYCNCSFCCCWSSEAAAAAVEAVAITEAVANTAATAKAALQYLQGAGIRTRDSATADRFTINELHSPPTEYWLSLVWCNAYEVGTPKWHACRSCTVR